MGSRLLSVFLFFISFAGALDARASGICDFYKTENPNLYKLFCEGRDGSASSKPAGANSTFSDAFNISSAALPTEPTGYGIETIGSWMRDGDGSVSPTFGLIKGFHRFGAAISTASNNTFYGNDIVQRLYGEPELKSFASREQATGKLTNLNLGTSLKLMDAGKGATVQLGLSARYNKITDSVGGGPALIFSGTQFSFGGGFTREKVSHLIPEQTFISYLLSTRVWIFEFEYNYLDCPTSPALGPIHIITGTTTIRRLTLTAAVRHLDYARFGSLNQNYYAIQYLFSKNISAGFLFNYIPGTNSVGLQTFF